jgi:DegV family protein with EDD domain
MEKIKIITDSTCAMPEALLADYPEIGVIPLYVHFGQTSYREGVDLKPEQFYPLLRSANDLPTSSQPSPGDFLAFYNPLLEKGYSIVSVHISSELSGTVSSAEQARQMANGRVEVVDSMQTGMGLGLVALEGARAVRAGCTLEQVVARIKDVREGIYNIFVVDTLEYLRRGGRISGTQALVGSILQVKPILGFRGGKIESIEKIPTKKRAQARMIQIIRQVREEHPQATLHLSIHEADNRAEGVALLAQMKEELRAEEGFLASLGAVLATHTGPGTLGITIFQEEEGKVIPAKLI